jgi:hypothetical protein
MVLERELRAFYQALPGLLRDPANRGKFALVHGDAVDSLWPTQEQGLDEGYRRFGLEPFLVQPVTEYEPPVYVSHRVVPCPSSEEN